MSKTKSTGVFKLDNFVFEGRKNVSRSLSKSGYQRRVFQENFSQKLSFEKSSDKFELSVQKKKVKLKQNFSRKSFR